MRLESVIFSLATLTFSLPGATALPRLGGVNLAGCEFGMNTDGTSDGFLCPPRSQVNHFKKQGANLIRLPIGWQYLIGSKTDANSEKFDEKVFKHYDKLVQRVIKDPGTYAIIDIHNYARFQGGLVGQGSQGATTKDFATLWWMIADRYKDKSNVIFGLMNEPWGVDVSEWAHTCQSAVNAIRAAGATSQIILLPGTGYSSSGAFFNGDNDPLLSITDPAHDSPASHLHFEAHKYIDGSGGGKGTDCVENGIAGAMEPFAAWLREKGRKAMITEFGAGNNEGCYDLFGQMVKYIADTDVFSGWTVWSAGSFNPTKYELSIVPVDGKDNELFNKAIKPYLPG